MADMPGKKDDGAEKAYATASAEAKAQPKPMKPKPVKPGLVKKAGGKPAATKRDAASPAPKAEIAKKPEPAPAFPAPIPKAKAPEPAAAPNVQDNTPPLLNESKDIPMASQPTHDFTETMNTAISEMQTRAKSAYDKSTELFSEAGELTKGNVEAVVESSRIFASGVQDLSKTYVDEAKTVYEQMTADMKEMASVKSPTELFQLQGKIMRRNFDALVATGSRNTEAVMKLANDSFAPISGRVNLAAEKLAKAG